MNFVISKILGATYHYLAKPLLFRTDPDLIHEKMITLSAKTQKIRCLNWLLRSALAYNNLPALRQNICGIEFSNPIGLGAGLDKNFEAVGVASAIGFGQIEGGSITFQPSPGNPKPWFHRLPEHQSIVVNAGLPNQGSAVILQRLRGYSKSQIGDIKINASVAYTNRKQTTDEAIKDFVASLELIKKSARVDLITLNISCPNVSGNQSPFTNPPDLEKLLRAVDRVKLGQPVFVKMPLSKSLPAFDKLLGVIARHNVAGVTIGNLLKDRGSVNLSSKVKGNLSGRPTFGLSNQLIAHTFQLYGDRLIIIGVGGVFDATDAYAKIRAGASLVEMVTGLIFEGPQIVGEINRELVRLLNKDGFKNVAEAVGVDNPAG
jgi:dihydroorotate dehydrogenase (fumarate)